MFGIVVLVVVVAVLAALVSYFVGERRGEQQGRRLAGRALKPRDLPLKVPFFVWSHLVNDRYTVALTRTKPQCGSLISAKLFVYLSGLELPDTACFYLDKDPAGKLVALPYVPPGEEEREEPWPPAKVKMAFREEHESESPSNAYGL